MRRDAQSWPRLSPSSRWPTSRTRAAWGVLLTTALIASCSSDCSCNRTSTSGAQQEGGAARRQRSEEEIARYRSQMMALLRVMNVEQVEQHTAEFVTPEGEKPTRIAPSLFGVLEARLGKKWSAQLRRAGSADLAWLVPASEGEPGRWFMVLPVQDRAAWLEGEQVSPIDEDVMRVELADGPAFLLREERQHARSLTTDIGPKVILASDAELAFYAMDLVDQSREPQAYGIQGEIWPRNLGLTDRWGGFSRELSQRLSASGHGLLPARANLVHVEAELFEELAAPESWPEPLKFHLDYKIKNGGPTLLRASLEARDLASHPLLTQLHEALQPRKRGFPPRPAEPGVAMITARLERGSIEPTFDALFPEPLRMMMASKGEDPMIVLRGLLSDLLDHHRGPMTVSLYPQTVPLSAEAFIGWEAIDLEELPEDALRFNDALVRNFWAPLHLVGYQDISAPQRVKLAKHTENEATRITFEVSQASGPVELGVCWTIHEKRYLSYLGERSCERLDALITSLEDEHLPAAATLDFDLSDAFDLLYLPPGRRLREPLGKKPLPIHIDVAAAQADGEPALTLSTSIQDRDVLRALLDDLGMLETLWSPNSELELSDLLQRVSMEQALYQEPGLGVVGLPGFSPGAPPAMYFGLPFSLPSAPPAQIKEAFTGEPAALAAEAKPR